MKSSTVLTALYGLNLVVALVGAGFLSAFLGQLYAEDPLMVFQMPVAVWVNGVAAFFGLLIVYLSIWLFFRIIRFDSGFSAVVTDTFVVIIFVVGGVATAAGLTSENVFRLNCRAQPMWSDVLALCLPAAIGASIAWGQVGLLLLTLTYIIVTMRNYPEGWKESMYTLSHPKRVSTAVINLDKSSTPSSFGSAYNRTAERKPLVGLVPEYPPRGAQGRGHTHRASDSMSSTAGSVVSPLSPQSPTTPSDGWPSRWGTPAAHQWPVRLPPAGVYAAYADTLPTRSHWSEDPVIPRPQPSLEMDRRGYHADLEQLVASSSPPRSRTMTQTLYNNPPPLSTLPAYSVQRTPLSPTSPTSPPTRLSNPPPLPPLPAHAQHLQTAPYEHGFGASRARARADSTSSSQPSLLEKEYLAAALNSRPLSRDFDATPASDVSNAPSWYQSPAYPPEKHTFTPEKGGRPPSPPSLTPTTSNSTTPKMRREFQLYGTSLTPLPPAWNADEATRKQEHQRELDRAREAELIARAHHKLSLEIGPFPRRLSGGVVFGGATPPQAHYPQQSQSHAQPYPQQSQSHAQPYPQQPQFRAQPQQHSPRLLPAQLRNSPPVRLRRPSEASDFGYPSEAVTMRARTREPSLPPPISPGEALALPLPREEWEEPRTRRRTSGWV